MLRHYLLTALRNFWRNRTYGLLNMLGLAVGVTCAALILLWVEDEVTFDRHHLKRAFLYQVLSQPTFEGTTYTFNGTPLPLAPALETELPGVVRAGRMTWDLNYVLASADKTLYEHGTFADPAILRMYTVEMLHGRAETALDNPASLVISESLAKRFFGADDPMGRPLKMNNGRTYTVTGVYRDQPANSSFRHQWLAPFTNFQQENPQLAIWSSISVQTFVELAPTADLEKVKKALAGFARRKDPKATGEQVLFAMSDWRLYSRFINGVQDGGRIEYVRMFSLVAGFILLIACINFMNLATARSAKRAREVGMRKVLGSSRGMLVGQFLAESLVLACGAVLAAGVLTQLALPVFNALVEKELVFEPLRPAHAIGLLTIALLTGLLAGSYPAFYLSSFRPVAVLKGLKLPADGGAGFIRKGLVVFQFTVSIALIIGTVIVYQQVRYAQGRDLGYEKEHLISLPLEGGDPQNAEAIRQELLATGVVENAALCFSSVLNLYNNTADIKWEGNGPGKNFLVTAERVTSDYFATLGTPLVAGRTFRSNVPADSTRLVVNEAMARLLKKPDVVGTHLTIEGIDCEIVGVVRNFLYNDFYQDAAPAFFFPNISGSTLLIRLKPAADLTAALARVERAMKKIRPAYPVEFRFFDQEFERTFQSERLIGRLAGLFAVLAVVISCLGLLGLAAYTAERRAREISIRKVLGASLQSIVGLLSKDFLRLVAWACLPAFALAWWAGRTWLARYPYRTELHWWVFAAAGGLALLIALATVSFQALKAAVVNPAKNLRSE